MVSGTNLDAGPYRNPFVDPVALDAAELQIRTVVGCLAGHPGVWTLDDVDRARVQANATLRPWGPKGPTPHEVFAARRPLTPRERKAFNQTVQENIQAELLTRTDERGRIITDTPFEVMYRRAITRALLEHDYLRIRRGRISKPNPQPPPDRIS